MPGLSDLDLAVVTRSRDDAARVRRRWRFLAERVPGIARAVDLAAYDQASLEAAAVTSTLTSTRPVHLAPNADPDDAGLLVRPGLYGPAAEWRRASGPGRRPGLAPPHGQQRRIAAWLELQFCWRGAFWGCRRPQGPALPLLCVKLVADPARIWLWLAHGERVGTRREALERARCVLPQEEEALSRALRLQRTLARSPRPPLGDALATLVRLSDRIARRLAAEVQGAGATGVRLTGASAELALPPHPLDELRQLVGPEPRLLPLADWRARAWPLFPDDAFCPTHLDPSQPDALAAAVGAAGGYGPYPALFTDDAMVLAGPGLLRAVQCRVTDPVSFALADGVDSACFPDVAGWSTADSARRAVAEHRAWVGADPDGRGPAIQAWAQAQGRTSAPATDVLGWLLSAARAGLFWETLREGDPQLAVTVAGAAAGLDERVGAGEVGAEAAAVYRRARRDGRPPPQGLVRGLRDAVLRLPAFGFHAPWEAHGRQPANAMG